MSDDLVKRLRTTWDADRSIISQTDNWMRERQEAADRIEELEAELSKSEALLAKAVEALEKLNVGEGWAAQIARTTLAELKGEK